MRGSARWLGPILLLAGCHHAVGTPELPDLCCGDLSHPPADLACAFRGPEDCFDGLDDDCNGLTDCADPACADFTRCVPQAPGFTLGALVDGGAECPVGFGDAVTELRQGLASDGPCLGCSCAPSLVCATTVHELATCDGAITRSWAADSATCENNNGAGNVLTTGAATVDLMTAHTACVPSGAPAPSPLGWRKQVRFCATAQTGGGCSTGFTCVRRAARPCALASGEGLVCTTDYAPEVGGLWYTDADDQRSCGAACGCGPPSGGACGSSYVRAYHSAGLQCSGASDGFVPATMACGLDPGDALSVLLAGTTQPTCTPDNQPTGAATPTGPHLLCCL